MEQLVESDVALVEQEPTHERDSRSIAECARFEKAGEPSKRVAVGAVFDAFAAPPRVGAESEERKSPSLGAAGANASRRHVSIALRHPKHSSRSERQTMH